MLAGRQFIKDLVSIRPVQPPVVPVFGLALKVSATCVLRHLGQHTLQVSMVSCQLRHPFHSAHRISGISTKRCSIKRISRRRHRKLLTGCNAHMTIHSSMASGLSNGRRASSSRSNQSIPSHTTIRNGLFITIFVHTQRAISGSKLRTAAKGSALLKPVEQACGSPTLAGAASGFSQAGTVCSTAIGRPRSCCAQDGSIGARPSFSRSSNP